MGHEPLYHVLIKANDLDKGFSRNLNYNDIIVYGHDFGSIREYFRRKGGVKITGQPVYGVWGSYRKLRKYKTESFDPDNLGHVGWGIGSAGGGWCGIPIVDDIITFGLRRAITTKRYFVALTQYDGIPVREQKYVRGQEECTVFLSQPPTPVSFFHIFELLKEMVPLL
jgi:hypothetical protein